VATVSAGDTAGGELGTVLFVVHVAGTGVWAGSCDRHCVSYCLSTMLTGVGAWCCYAGSSA